MLCPTRFVVETTENRKEGGVAAEVCNSQTGYELNQKATCYCCCFPVFLTINNRYDAVRGHRTGSTNSGVEDYLTRKTNKNRR